jgi:hypothetical protein
MGNNTSYFGNSEMSTVKKSKVMGQVRDLSMTN